MSYKIATGILAISATGAQMSLTDFSNQFSRRARKRRRGITNLQNYRARTAFMRSFKAQQAQALSASVPLGLDSSSAMVQQQNFQTQGTQALADNKVIARLDREAYQAEEQAAKAAQRANRAGGIAGALGGI